MSFIRHRRATSPNKFECRNYDSHTQHFDTSAVEGKSPLPIESATVEQLVTAGITSIAALIAWWKNNSFTKEAIAADAEYDRLRKQNRK